MWNPLETVYGKLQKGTRKIQNYKNKSYHDGR